MKRISDIFLIILSVLLIFSIANAEEDGDYYYKSGVFAYEDGDYEEAEKNLKKALDFNPNNPLYNYFLGKICLKTEQYDIAAYYLRLTKKTDPNIPGFQYDWAFLNYKRGNFAEADKHFRTVVKKDPSNALARYHAGMSLYQLKRYGKAVEHLVKSAEMSPSIRTNALYHAGVCYWNIGRVGKAVEKFKYVKDNAETENLKANALNWLQTAETETPKKIVKPYSLYLKIGYQYDGNVRLEPLDREDMYANEADSVLEAYFSGAYNFINTKALKAGAGYSHYQNGHNDLGQYDLIGSIPDLYIKYTFDPLTFGLAYTPSFFWVDSESYLKRHQLTPYLMWRAGENLFAKFSYRFQRNDYSDSTFFQDNDDRDGNAHNLSADIYYGILDKKGSLFGGIAYETSSADRSDESYDRIGLKLGLFLELPYGFDFNMMGRYYDKKHDAADISYNIKQNDDKYFCALSLYHKLRYDWLGILAEYDYTKNDSNIRDYKYDRNVLSISLTADY